MDSSAVTLSFLDDRASIVTDECARALRTYRTSDRVFEFGFSLGLGLYPSCPENEAFSSLRRAEKYSVTDQSGSEVLMLWIAAEETLKLMSLPAVGLDVEQREWSLRNIVDIGPGWPIDFARSRGEAVLGSVVTLSFQDSNVTG